MPRFNFSLICAPQAIARVLRLFPKLALLFLIVHVGLMIYSVINSSGPVRKSNKRDQTDPELAIVERLLSTGVNDSLAKVKLNNSEHARNLTLEKGKFAQNFLYRGHNDVR